MHAEILLYSWLEARTARVTVGGAFSRQIAMGDIVFQGAVLGPPFWHLFFSDAREATVRMLFQEVVDADDQNAWCPFSFSRSDDDTFQPFVTARAVCANGARRTQLFLSHSRGSARSEEIAEIYAFLIASCLCQTPPRAVCTSVAGGCYI